MTSLTPSDSKPGSTARRLVRLRRKVAATASNNTHIAVCVATSRARLRAIVGTALDPAPYPPALGRVRRYLGESLSHPADSARTMWRLIFLSSVIIVPGCAADQSAANRTRAGRPVAPGVAARELLDRPGFAWQTLDGPNARIHTPRGAAVSRDAATLADSAERARQAALAILGESDRVDEPKLELFFVDSRDDMQRLVGRPLGGFAQPGELTAAFVAGPGYRPFLRHELTHAYSYVRWGELRGGTWLTEGLAALAQGPCQGHTVDALAAGYLAGGRLPTVRELASDFRRIPELPGYMAAASLADFVRQREGTEGVRDRWQGRRAENHPLGPNGAEVERAWRAHLQSTVPAALDSVRLHASGC